MATVHAPRQDEGIPSHEPINLVVLHRTNNPPTSTPSQIKNAASQAMGEEDVLEKQATRPKTDAEPERPIVNLRATDGPSPTTNKLSPLNLFLTMFSLCVVVFLVALDKTILATAIPRITDDFKSIDQAAWYGSAYLLTASCFQLVYGRLYTIFGIKSTYLSAVFIFELGSLICAVAPNSAVLILGRSIGGIGGSGITNGSLVILSHIAPMEKRPILTGTIMGTSGIAMLLGPVLGGILTDKLTWRWCFAINIPLGVVAVTITTFLIKSSQLKSSDCFAEMPLLKKLTQIDFTGLAILLPATVCLLLALEWGGSSYPWSSARIIVLLVIVCLCVPAFIFAQSRSGTRATLPLRIIKKRSIAFGCGVSSLLSGSYMLLAYFLPLYFQTIKGLSAEKSGYFTLPLVLFVVACSLLSGALTTKLGYYTPWSILGCAITTTATSLLTTIRLSTPAATYLSFQGLAGFGLGLSSEVPIIAAQTVCVLADTPAAISLVLFAQSIGGTVFLVVGQNVFNQMLLSGAEAISPALARSILGLGATEIRAAVDLAILRQVLAVYNKAIVGTIYVAVGTSAVAFLLSTGIEWKSVRAKKEQS